MRSRDAKETVGTIIHVVGEPLMAGYALERKRRFDGQNDLELKKLIHLGSIDHANVYTDSSLESMIRDHVPKSLIERLAASTPPPPRGQNVRAPIDGVSNERHRSKPSVAKNGLWSS
jgi:hypothetical protein